jgi:hypothetical protein
VPKTLELTVHRNMSTPVVVRVVPEHLPDPVRHHLDGLGLAIAHRNGLRQQAASAAGVDKQLLMNQAEAADVAVRQALSDFGDSGAAATTAIRDSALAAFAKAADAASGAVRAALDALAEASDAAALYASARPGKPVLRIDGRSAAEAPVRQQLGMVRSELRELLSRLPDDIDG